MDGKIKRLINHLIQGSAPYGHEIQQRLLVEGLAEDLMKEGVSTSVKECVEEFERQTAIRGLREGRAKEPPRRHVRVRVLDRLLVLGLKTLRTLPPGELPPAWEKIICPRLEGYNHRMRAWVIHLVKTTPLISQRAPGSSQIMAAFLFIRREAGDVEASRIPSQIKDVETAWNWKKRREEMKANNAVGLWPPVRALRVVGGSDDA